MMQSQFDFVLAAPEIFLLAMSMLILLADAFWGGGRRALAYGLSLATLAVLFILTFLQWTQGCLVRPFLVCSCQTRWRWFSNLRRISLLRSR
jgi:NADH-quinone oxidoreductase subunit N